MRLPTALHRSYSRARREYGPQSIAGLIERWPISGGKQYQDSAATTPAGAADPVGNLDGALGAFDFVQATTSKKPTLDAAGPAIRYDMIDDLLQATYSLNPSYKWAIAFALWSRDDSDSIALDELDGVTNLAGEFAMRINEGDNRQVTMPGNWDPDSWCIAGWFVPDFASNDGSAHRILDLYLNASNVILLQKTAAGALQLSVTAGGVQVTSNLTPSTPFAAGTPVFVGARWDGANQTLYFDTDGDGTLNTDADANANAIGAGTYTGHIGKTAAGIQHLEGALNLLITNDGSSAAPITDRFNGGAGLALGGDQNWLSKASGNGLSNGENLVLHVGGNSSGSAYQIDTAYNALDLLAGTATGRLDFNGTTSYADFGNVTGFDAATKGWMLVEVEFDAVTGEPNIIARWGGTDNTKQFKLFLADVASTYYLRFFLAADLAGTTFTGRGDVAFVAGERAMVLVRIDLTAGTDAGRLKIDTAKRNASTRKYAAWVSNTLTFTGTAPAAFTTPASSTSMYAGRQTSGSYLDGKIDDFRWTVGSTLTDAQRDALLVNEADPATTQRWYPFDGDAADAIGGGPTATLSNTPYVDDGRHHLGRMERWLKQGQYCFPAAAYISTPDPGAGADGIAQCTWEIYLTATGVAGALLGRLNTADNQFLITEEPTGFWVRVCVDGTDVTTRMEFTGISGWAAGKKYKATFVYDGSLTNESRVVLYLKEFDPATGTYAAQTAPSGAVTGTIPTTLRASALGYRFGSADTFTPVSAGLCLDEVRIWYGVALTSGEADAESIYAAPVKAGCSHRWDFDGDAVDSVAALNGTVTSAFQWYDGRQPEGLALESGAEIDRATGTNQSPEGTYGVRVERSGGVGITPLSLTTASLTSGRWVAYVGKGRETVASTQLVLAGSAFPSVPTAQIPTQATMADIGRASRVEVTGSGSLRVNNTGSTAESYIDNLRALQLATLSLSVSTSGVPSRVPISFTKAGALQPYFYAAVATDEKLEIGGRNDAGTRTEASSSGSLTTGAHSLILEWDPGTSTLSAYVDSALVASVVVSGGLTGLDRLNLGGMPLFVEGHPFDERLGEGWLHAGADFPGYSAIDRKRLHNYLAARTTGLSAL